MFRRLSLMILPGLLMLSACAPSAGDAPPPNLPSSETDEVIGVPGMPDRPATADEVIQPFYREDQLEAIGATGRPQIVVFWAPSYETGGCIECDILRPGLQELEAEFWDRVDFVYLNHEREDVSALRESYGIPDQFYRLDVLLMSPEGELVRRFYDVTVEQGLGLALDDNVIRSALNKYLLEQEG